ncbi:MAG: WD40 repeat domain-containing protein [Rhizonema sp. PD38]|nr:WD40 repeat domain-containing protein [Rhizonema sp. PD38]
MHTLTGHTDEVRAVAVTIDGRQAISASNDSTLKIWDLQTGKALHTLTGHTHYVRSVIVTPDGQRAISASADATLKVWDLITGEALYTLAGHTAWVRTVVLMPDGRRVVSTSWDHSLAVWDLEQGDAIACFTGESRMLTCAVTPDGATIVAGEESGQVHFLRLENLDSLGERSPLHFSSAKNGHAQTLKH